MEVRAMESSSCDDLDEQDATTVVYDPKLL
jgi:hypothetical protein